MKANELDLLPLISQAFPGMTEAEAHRLIEGGEIRQYPAGAVMCQEGRQEDTFYIILEGEARVTKYINDDEARLLQILRRGDFFGEIALIHETARTASVTAISPLTVLEIRKAAFNEVMKQSSHMSLAIARELSNRLRENNDLAVEDLRLKASELADAYQQLAEQSYARRVFLTTIAHELRTPLTVINGYVEMLRSGKMPPQSQSMALNKIADHLQRVTSLVNDLLFLQEMDLIGEKRETVDIAQLVQVQAAAMHEMAKTNQCPIALEIEPDLRPVYGDQAMLGRAIGAVLHNAVKFSPNGGEIRIAVETDGNDALRIVVEDHGIGIPPNLLPRIFERYFHTDRRGEHVFEGAGLGLAIAKQVIESHGGQITAQSVEGQGTTVTLRLPVVHTN